MVCNNKEKNILYSWIHNTPPTELQNYIWNIFVKIFNEPGKKLELTQTISVTNAIEQIRIQSFISSDKLNLTQTMTYLESISEKSEFKDFFMTLAERYAYSILSPASPTNKNPQFRNKILFPSIIKNSSVVLEDELADLANVFLAKRFYNANDYLQAERHLIDVSPQSNQMDEVCKMLSSIYDKMANDIDDENDDEAKDVVKNLQNNDKETPLIDDFVDVQNESSCSYFSATQTPTTLLKDTPQSKPKVNEPNSTVIELQSQINHFQEEFMDLKKIIYQCIKHNELLLKVFQPVSSINTTKEMNAESVDKILDNIKICSANGSTYNVKFILSTEKPLDCVVQFYNDDKNIRIKNSTTNELIGEYQFDSKFQYQIINFHTIRFLNMKKSNGKFVKLFYLTLKEQNKYQELVNQVI